MDINLGGEYYFRKLYPVRTGYFTSLSSAPETTGTGEGQATHIDLQGLTFSVGREREHVALNAGLMYIFGSGNAFGYYNPDTAAYAVIDSTERNLYFFVTTAYMF